MQNDGLRVGEHRELGASLRSAVVGQACPAVPEHSPRVPKDTSASTRVARLEVPECRSPRSAGVGGVPKDMKQSDTQCLLRNAEDTEPTQDTERA